MRIKIYFIVKIIKPQVNIRCSLRNLEHECEQTKVKNHSKLYFSDIAT